ncbi:MAG: lytic murein transglycosylase B [Gemmatimonadota bacterium]
MRRRALLRFGLAALAALPLRAQSAAFVPYLKRDDVHEFIDALSARGDLSRHWIERAFARGRYLPAVERLMQPPIPFGQRNWREYRARYVETRRIGEGVLFFDRHRATLQRAADEYGVPAGITAAVLGIETHYGRMIGTFRTLDVLLTLSFDYLRRADYFRGELEQFLLLARENRLDPLAVHGSFAGAIGIPQFMPSSIRRWAVDFDASGRIDLVGSVPDSIGSVANFLAGHGWQRDEPILLAAALQPGAVIESFEPLAEPFGGIRADAPWSLLASVGVQASAPLAPDTRVLLVDLPIIDADGSQSHEYRIGTRNFAALLNYNRSYFYAASVVELADAIAT